MAVNMKTVTDLLGDYVDRPTLAEAWGICPRTVAAYEKQGLPSILIGGRTANAARFSWVIRPSKRHLPATARARASGKITLSTTPIAPANTASMAGQVDDSGGDGID